MLTWTSSWFNFIQNWISLVITSCSPRMMTSWRPWRSMMTRLVVRWRWVGRVWRKRSCSGRGRLTVKERRGRSHRLGSGRRIHTPAYVMLLLKHSYCRYFGLNVKVRFLLKKLIRGCIKLIKSDSKDVYNVPKYSISSKCCSFELSIHQRILKKLKSTKH